ncbi:MAG: hypothetical protein GY827_01750 [Cytophagales bacterium]|nr:hypothetical protein [Cytophagales bacterium]
MNSAKIDSNSSLLHDLYLMKKEINKTLSDSLSLYVIYLSNFKEAKNFILEDDSLNRNNTKELINNCIQEIETNQKLSNSSLNSLSKKYLFWKASTKFNHDFWYHSFSYE